jgi:hypothetical protein
LEDFEINFEFFGMKGFFFLKKGLLNYKNLDKAGSFEEKKLRKG